MRGLCKMGDIEKLKAQIRFLTHAAVKERKKARVHYSQGSYTKETGIPEGTITIYAKDYGFQLPKELNAENQSDMMTDYFETDRARIKPDSIYYKDVLKALNKAKAKDQKLLAKRKAKYGW